MGSSDIPVTLKLTGFALYWMGTHLRRGAWNRRLRYASPVAEWGTVSRKRWAGGLIHG